jgi:hypothetical protein
VPVEAELRSAGVTGPPSARSVELWLGFIRTPTPASVRERPFGLQRERPHASDGPVDRRPADPIGRLLFNVLATVAELRRT